MAVCKNPKLFALLVPRGTELFAKNLLAQKFRFFFNTQILNFSFFGPRESELFGKMVPQGSELLVDGHGGESDV